MISQLCYYNPALIPVTSEHIETDICIYGGNAAGVVAAIQAVRMGKNAVVLEPSGHLGGLTTGGLSKTDTGNKTVIGGLSLEFYQRCGAHYGVDVEWTFEPHVAERVLTEMLQESGAPIYYRQFLQSVEKSDGRIRSITLEGGRKVTAKCFIDCSYEGDLMAQAGVNYHVGRESNSTYGETLNGVQFQDKHQFDFPVDPYIVPGDPSSGLLPGIDPAPLPANGTGDQRVQAYNFRLCMTPEAGNKLPPKEPEEYNPLDYELIARYVAAGWKDQFRYMKMDKPNLRANKSDVNNHGATSTDYIGANYDYPEASYARREEIFQAHVRYHKGWIWFWNRDERVPIEMREYMNQWGLAADEFTQTGGWPHQLYVREARRMTSDYVMTEHDCFGSRTTEDPVGMASYTMDSHNCRRFIQDGRVYNEGNVEVRVPPYKVSLRSIRPRRAECENLLVPVCLSCSHIAYGSVRMEPVFMLLGQSAATVASIALENKCAVQDVDYSALRTQLENDGQVLDLPTQ
jgi:hypothetical protein